jgi:hypothetical protein
VQKANEKRWGEEKANWRGWPMGTNKLPGEVLGVIVRAGHPERVKKMIDVIKTKRVMMNEPELFTYECAILVILAADDEGEIKKMCIEMAGLFKRQLLQNAQKYRFYVENTIIFMEEIEEFEEIKR